jgi:hypothetical protein
MTDYLSVAEVKKFGTYKHNAPKITFEKFYVEKALVPFEKLYPRTWSANTITLLGQSPMLLFLIFIWVT